MLLGLSVINVSADCSCPPSNWEVFQCYEYTQLDADKHDVKCTDVTYCKLCYDTWVSCTHWYSEPHNFVIHCLGYVDSIQMYEYERYCPDCGYGEIYYLPY
jgi:histone deacetylase complex regulatory component SIN3